MEGETRKVKLERGDAVMYTTGTPHRVEPLVSGERLVIIGWIQSLIADPWQRQILANFQRLHHRLTAEQPDSDLTEQFNQPYMDLVRLWSRT